MSRHFTKRKTLRKTMLNQYLKVHFIRRMSLVFVCFTIGIGSIFSQASMNLWRNVVPHEGQSPHAFHEHHDKSSKEIHCGYEAYFFFENGTRTNQYSICNSGDANLDITLPLQFTGNGALNLISISQPIQSSISPNTCVDFSMTYTPLATYADVQGSITINSNDNANPSCQLNYEVGGLAIATPTPTNNDCADAIDITGMTSILGTNVGASLGVTVEMIGACDDVPTSLDNQHVFYSIMGEGNLISLSTSNEYTADNFSYDGDTQIFVFSGDCTNRTCIAANDDNNINDIPLGNYTSTTQFLAESGTTYIIVVGGLSDQNGPFQLDITNVCPEGLTNYTAPAAVVKNSTCTTMGDEPTLGSISAPVAGEGESLCPEGSNLEYSTDNGDSWSTTVPTYNQTEAMTIMTRCNCDLGGSSNVQLLRTTDVSSITTSVPTDPDTCPTAAAIPTMSQWGLMIFGLLVLNLGVVFLYRREELMQMD